MLRRSFAAQIFLLEIDVDVNNHYTKVIVCKKNRAPEVGLEPTTTRLKALRSTD